MTKDEFETEEIKKIVDNMTKLIGKVQVGHAMTATMVILENIFDQMDNFLRKK